MGNSRLIHLYFINNLYVPYFSDQCVKYEKPFFDNHNFPVKVHWKVLYTKTYTEEPNL